MLIQKQIDLLNASSTFLANHIHSSGEDAAQGASEKSRVHGNACGKPEIRFSRRFVRRRRRARKTATARRWLIFVSPIFRIFNLDALMRMRERSAPLSRWASAIGSAHESEAQSHEECVSGPRTEPALANRSASACRHCESLAVISHLKLLVIDQFCFIDRLVERHKLPTATFDTFFWRRRAKRGKNHAKNSLNVIIYVNRQASEKTNFRRISIPAESVSERGEMCLRRASWRTDGRNEVVTNADLNRPPADCYCSTIELESGGERECSRFDTTWNA